MIGFQMPVEVHVDVAFVLIVVPSKVCPTGHEYATTVPMLVQVMLMLCVYENGMHVAAATITYTLHS